MLKRASDCSGNFMKPTAYALLVEEAINGSYHKPTRRAGGE